MKIWFKTYGASYFCFEDFLPFTIVKGKHHGFGLQDDLTHVCRGMAEAGEWISIVVPLPL